MNKQLLQGIDTVIVRVSNIERSKEWYIGKLGLKSLYEDSNLRLVVLDTFGPTSLTIWETDEAIQINAGTAAFPIFKTSNAEDALAELKKLGVVAGELISDSLVSYFKFFDPDNNVLEACEVHD